MKFIKPLLIFSFICMILGVTTIFGFYYYLKPQLPDVATLKDVQLQTPMQVFSQDGKLIAQFGEKRRIPLKLDEIPLKMQEAFIATEDSRFYQHYGIDPIGIARAAVVVAISGSAKQGASTITQQLARNFFLSNDKKIMRKIKEIFIALHIEQVLNKQEILELYLNKIYLGYRSYGVGAASLTYFGKEPKDLTLGQMAIIAGLPKAPSTMNPIYSIDRAKTRRHVVLLRMLEEKYITQEEFDAADAEPIDGEYHGAVIEVNAPYVAELARSWAVKRYGEEAYSSGMQIYTTVKSNLQEAANEAAIGNLLRYDERHGYRGPEAVAWKATDTAFTQEQMDAYLKKQPTFGLIRPALVTSVSQRSATVYIKNRGTQTIEWDGIKWARKYINDRRQGFAPKKATDILEAGHQIWVRPMGVLEDKPAEEETENLLTKAGTEAADAADTHENLTWQLSQVPIVNTAFVALNPEDGAVLSLVGGFNFVHSKFDRATMANRQVGSSIKPFIYSAALDKGLTLATLINDAPINQWDKGQGTAWRPKNSPPTYLGPTMLRQGLAQSKNVMAVRTLRRVGLDDMLDYLPRFGFDRDKLPRSETIALGAGSLTPIKMAQGISVFANGGYYVEPFYIDHVNNPYGDLVFRSNPTRVCTSNCSSDPITIDDKGTQEAPKYAEKVISPQTAFLVRQMMYSNVWGGGNWSNGTGWNGTGWRGQALDRRDIGGKTGTTNDSVDTWYNGYGPGIVASTWVGFDGANRPLGYTAANPNFDRKDQYNGGESGGTTAQPAWVDFMKVALKGVPEQPLDLPPGIIRVRIDVNSGLLTKKNDSSSMWEYFDAGTQPTEYVSDDSGTDLYTEDADGDSLF
ncbi:penicillin-binding protein 1A [Vibrio rumoiensis]|uniref:Penicillin-binding protein 1A n=1 Tax=Vibrio rumoiensis 1S-45 TaxID=1188252 RepID=A0A1E5E6E8_9VIBR|nr:PBP1A family penicillin-binding protein [Vibrio rumoiensis]OEF30061.1 penicillin-sensitive transpeptidase [Vibrio rumoiensis 1S-45]